MEVQIARLNPLFCHGVGKHGRNGVFYANNSTYRMHGDGRDLVVMRRIVLDEQVGANVPHFHAFVAAAGGHALVLGVEGHRRHHAAQQQKELESEQTDSGERKLIYQTAPSSQGLRSGIHLPSLENSIPFCAQFVA